jgi:hypothetical protein
MKQVLAPGHGRKSYDGEVVPGEVTGCPAASVAG